MSLRGDHPARSALCGRRKSVVEVDVKHRWWDETIDAGKFTTSKIFDAALGFGGSGKGTSACVPDGLFANVTVMIGPGFKSQARCINRRVSNPMSQYSSKSVVDAALKATNYIAAYTAISAGPHTMGHGALMMMVSGRAPTKVMNEKPV